jgi:hypothetical protein
MDARIAKDRAHKNSFQLKLREKKFVSVFNPAIIRLPFSEW